jgi:hypothetical protein
MSETALDTFLATQDAWSIPLIRALDEAIHVAGPTLESRYAYQMLLYSPPGWPKRRWLCGISTSTSRVHLRFLAGTSLPDPNGILRGGTSTLMSIDYTTLDGLDREIAGAYVRDALTVAGEG